MTSPTKKYEVVEETRGAVLHIACGLRKAYPHFLGVDTPREGVRPDIRVEDTNDLSLVIEDASVDAIYHEGEPPSAAALVDWWRCIKVGGFFIQVSPDAAGVVNVMREAAGDWDLVRREEGLSVFKKLGAPGIRNSWLASVARPKKRVCVVRYGGFGDMIQAANILPELKRQGYHVTFMTTPKGQDILRHDPNIDAWFIQDHDQVPNHELPIFWEVVSKRFTKFVNLCESVEGTLLAMPGRSNHAWPQALRHERMNDNYLEFTAKLAEVPYASEARFYPSEEEKAAAEARLGSGLNVLWALAGSSCHKFYPGQDAVIARFLVDYPDCRVFLVGDEACKILELGWENEERVVCLSGELGIRDTLALAQVCDVVIGCETGVLNAVAFEGNRKVCLLSHSSHENLTKHWTNTFAMAPQGLDCYPCHRLHHTRDFCREDAETGAAMCQRVIDPADVYGAATFHGDV